jgi:hypothetical protein
MSSVVAELREEKRMTAAGSMLRWAWVKRLGVQLLLEPSHVNNYVSAHA